MDKLHELPGNDSWRLPLFIFLTLMLPLNSMQAQPFSNQADSLLQLFQQSTNDSIKWQLLIDAGNTFLSVNSDSVIYYATQSLEFAEKYLPQKIPSSLNNIGLGYLHQDAYEKASSFFIQSIEASKKYPCAECVTKAIGNMGIIAYRKKEFKKARETYRENIPKHWELNDTLGVIRMYNNIALTFSEVGVLDSALVNYRQALSLAEQVNYKIIGMITQNIGILYYYLGDYEKSVEYYQKGFEYAQKEGDRIAQSLAMGNISYSYLQLAQYDKAIEAAQQALEISIPLKHLTVETNSYEVISEAYENKKQYKEALYYQKKFVVAKDSINQDLYSKTIADLEAKYESDKKETSLSIKQLELERQTKLRNLTLGMAILAILILAGIFQYFRQRQKIKQREIELIAELQKSEANKLRELDQMKSNFFANISHEFRTPLTLIIGPAEQMLDSSLPADNKQWLRTIRQNGYRLLNLVNQMLDLSKLESGKMTLHKSTELAQEIFKTMAYSFQSKAESIGIVYQVNFPEEDIWVEWDRDKVEKMLTNLLSNAFKFTDAEGAIIATMKKEEDFITLSVVDNGLGISALDQAHVFERYFQSRDSHSHGVGSGIGLALTKELTELHGGHIEMKSEENKGSIFTLFLPVGNPDLTIPATVKTAMKSPLLEQEQETTREKIAPKQDQPHLLLVEDNEDLRHYIRLQLQENYWVEEANDGLEGMEKAIENTPDLIISDIMMPRMDGVEMCKALKTNEKTSHIPIILLTAKAEQTDKLEGLEIGADAYLTKPFDPRELQIRVRKLVEQREVLRAKFSSDFNFKPTEVAVTSADQQFLEKIKMIIETHLGDELFGVPELSKAIGFSRSQLHRKLKALTEKSPSQLIREMRLYRAKELLEKKAGNASEIAYECGFSSLSQFSKTFKNFFGISPSEVGS